MSKIIVLMGAPGAGKGTQARLLQERLKLPQISTGDIFRSLKDSQTSLAQEVREIMAQGRLVRSDRRPQNGFSDCASLPQSPPSCGSRTAADNEPYRISLAN